MSMYVIDTPDTINVQDWIAAKCRETIQQNHDRFGGIAGYCKISKDYFKNEHHKEDRLCHLLRLLADYDLLDELVSNLR